MRRFAALLACLLLTLTGLVAHAPMASAAPSPVTLTTGKLVWASNFTGPYGAYDHSQWSEWSACTYNGSAAYGSIGCGDRAHIDGKGRLLVPANPKQGTSISTGLHYRFTYGTITACMEGPVQVGYWPAFWVLNNNPSGNPNNATVGEIDVTEQYTTWPGYRRATHNYTPAGTWSSADDPYCAQEADTGTAETRGVFHDYWAKIEPGRVTFYFDGKQCGPVETSTDPESGGKPYALDSAPKWLLLTLAVGGAGGQQKPATTSADLIVDSVDVYANS